MMKPNQPKVGFKQYVGYVFLDDETHDRVLFYYFVEAENDPASKPVVLWLNGGPGCSLIGQGAFGEHGPFKPTREGHVVKNQYSWNRGNPQLRFNGFMLSLMVVTLGLHLHRLTDKWRCKAIW
ncbi:hypothetical protein TSUD_405350 [Trifolium subterraneum]|uniref:Uncharacterized protein n=1 Tax=Trifolium subterraneum TaxID=3900 RepID=A0A2Z6P1G3_TRISU|nr:hypothetical protein TSUD_405350 [Trifolium subterraneum]